MSLLGHYLVMKMRLSEAQVGKEYIIKSMSRLGRRIRGRLSALGMVGCKFKIMHNSGVGPMLIEVRETRQALGRGLVRKIEVEEASYEGR